MENKNHIFPSLLTLLFMLVGFISNANATAGKVEFATQGAVIQNSDGVSKVMTKGLEINQGDTILTGAGRAQVKFNDGAYMSFQPNTEFKVEEYNYNGQQDGSEKSFFRLVKGGLRAISGLVGREHRPAYKLATPVATIGIRGTYYLAEFNEKLKAHVGQGSVYIFNEFGDIILFKGQGAEVYPGKAPAYSDKEMTLGAAGPQGGQPDQTNSQESVDNQLNSIFKVAEQYADDGLACLNRSCNVVSSIAALANLGGINAQAYYVLDNSVANNGGGMGWTSKVSSVSLLADFANYSISGPIIIASSTTVNSLNINTVVPASDSFIVTGSILKSGSFTLTGSNISNYQSSISFIPNNGSVCSGSCTINVIGLFNGPQAEKANIGYVINGASDSVGNVGQINGTAGIVKTLPPPPSFGP